MKATDSSERSILAHAVLSGQLQVFDAAFCAAREQIPDHEVWTQLITNLEHTHRHTYSHAYYTQRERGREAYAIDPRSRGQIQVAWSRQLEKTRLHGCAQFSNHQYLCTKNTRFNPRVEVGSWALEVTHARRLLQENKVLLAFRGETEQAKPGHIHQMHVPLRTVIHPGSVFLLFRSPHACAYRQEQIEDLMNINMDDDEESAMEATLVNASKKMKMLVDRRDQQLKVGLATSENGRTRLLWQAAWRTCGGR